MMINTAANVNDALENGLHLMLEPSTRVLDTRGGKVLRHNGPVATVSADPYKRVLFSPMRNANPFFHFMEAIWMLAGRNDLPWLAQFNKRMAEYSDDGGKTQPAAYGHRWRRHFGYDQLNEVIQMLRADPSTRRAVLAMWDGGENETTSDLVRGSMGGKDVPCNTHAYFSIVDGKLDMMVCCRSNDLWWGAHGANAVHFSILQEYVAASVGVGLGTMTQVSNDYHLYTDVVPQERIAEIISDVSRHDYYFHASVQPTTLFYDEEEVEAFDRALNRFMLFADPVANPPRTPMDPEGRRAEVKHLPMTGSFVIDKMAYPMLRAWDAQKVGSVGTALMWCEQIGTVKDCDWRVACQQWLQRKFTAKGITV
jgi:thymidylate synthase